MGEIMNGEVTPAQFAAFVTALRLKGETVEEIAGLASAMQSRAIPVPTTSSVIDTCGTGGDNSCSFNISTATAFVVAAAGLKVAKHGNRAMSSQCGSADVLEALGVKIDLGPQAVAECVEKIGIGFMFAPNFHPAMKYAAAPRKEIGIRTVFNFLGPLTNPAKARFQVVGVPSKEWGERIALALHRLGTAHSLVVCGLDGMDELSISGKSLVWDVTPSGVAPPYEVSPEDFGFARSSLKEVKGGTARQNARILRSVLAGEVGARRNVVVINAAAALTAGNLASNLREGILIAEKVIDSGEALAKLEQLVQLSQSLAARAQG
jgi:anthranilate phosphoribosyltransferase